MGKYYSKEEFIEKAKKIYGNKYDYSLIEYTNSQTKVAIVCPIHGVFYKKPTLFLHGQECPKCGRQRGFRKQMKTTEQFIEEAKVIQNEKYDYSKVIYEGENKKVCIICPEHGEFWQTPHNHLKGCSCPKCAGFNVRDNEEFIKVSNDVHNNKYNYEKSVYVKTDIKVCITCPKHGDFWMIPLNHIRGQGCPKCKYERFAEDRRLTKEEFIEKSKVKHGDLYCYDKITYINNRTKVCITCPKHGDFWMRPENHLQGQRCPSCQQSYLETNVEKFLSEKGVTYEKQKRFDWLFRKSLDFYLPEYNSAIECQGIQHFKPVRFNNSDKYSAKESFERITNRDKAKLKECEENGVKLYYYSNLDIDYPYLVYENFEELLKAIQNDNK